MTYTARQFEIASVLDKHGHDSIVHGLTRLAPLPQCEWVVKAKWRTNRTAGRCTIAATWLAADGTKLCHAHALRWAEANDHE